MRKPKAVPKEAVLSVRIPLRMKKKIEQEALRYRVSQNSIIIDALRDRMEPERREARANTPGQ
jgi:hypothetical protein